MENFVKDMSNEMDDTGILAKLEADDLVDDVDVDEAAEIAAQALKDHREEEAMEHLRYLKDMIQEGILPKEYLEELRQLTKPQTDAQRKSAEAKKALETFLDFTLSHDIISSYATVRDLYKDIQDLQADIKVYRIVGKRRPNLATKKWAWVNPKDRTNFLIILDGYEGQMSVHPDSDKIWKEYFLSNGFTIGQINAVRKGRPYRVNKGGFISMEEVLDIT